MSNISHRVFCLMFDFFLKAHLDVYKLYPQQKESEPCLISNYLNGYELCLVNMLRHLLELYHLFMMWI